MTPRTVGIFLLVLLTPALMFTALEVDLPWLEGLNTYGNFDVPNDRAFVTYLLPGIEDTAALQVYRFGHGLHWTPIIALFIVFILFFVLRGAGSLDVKLGVHRWFTQWAAFVIARYGLIRVSGAAPVRRCTFGIFPFLNCQACEMASGGCPIGALQASLMQLRFPMLPLLVLVLTGIWLGRWICGWLCPLGMLSDMFDRISQKVWKPALAWSGLKYVILVLIFVLPLAMGLFGGATFLPFCATVCSSGSVFGLLPFYATTGVPPFADAFATGNLTAILTIAFHTIVLVGFVFLAIRISGRVFCRYVCPMGAFLGLFHRFSLVRVVHVGDDCLDCGKCEGDCPMGLNLADPHFLVQSQCIRCARCVKYCPSGARQWVFGFGEATPVGKKSREPRLVTDIPVLSDLPRPADPGARRS